LQAGGHRFDPGHVHQISSGSLLILSPIVSTTALRRSALFALLILLTLVEIYMCTAFLPLDWQHSINDHISDILPKAHDSTPTTHPRLSQEIEQVLSEHIGLRFILFAVTLVLLIGNVLLICFVWRLLRRYEN
jgi:hypothetical protein